ncbi:MAG: type IV conjugative transfer system protein TraE [Syntrophobacterales bacterium]|jgi:conjugal transfer pilus assembly protein TraE|nr:type IV conjugative transfer system protein TraE [Syntrophobacterales bacterium]
MDIKKFLSSYRGIRTENLSYRVICGVLLLSNLILGAAVFARKDTVVLVPPMLREESKVSLKKADQKYQETWALYFALLLGNITPRNVEFVAAEIEKYLAPSIYQDVIKDVVEQAQGIKAANLSTTFEPRELVFDDKTGHVLVKGQMVMRGAFGKPQNVGKTFEFEIAVKNYYPQIAFLNAYDKKPKEEKPDAKAKSKEPETPQPGN